MFLLISNVYATGCLDSYENELQHYASLNSELDKKISELQLDKNSEQQFRKSITNDPLGMEITQSLQCLENMKDPNSKTANSETDRVNSIFTFPLIGAVIGSIIGAVVAIWGTEKRQHKIILKNGKTAIKFELSNIRNILNNTVTASSGSMTFTYSPNTLSTTAFDSIVSSGAFLHFPIDLQERLTIIYFHIREQNTLLEKLENLIATSHIQNVLPTTATVLIRYYDGIVFNQGLLSNRFLVSIDNLFGVL